MRKPVSINYRAVVNHLNGNNRNEFERRRNEDEYNRMVKHIRIIADEPFYRWLNSQKDI